MVNGLPVAAYWKDGVVTTLSNKSSYATGIAISGNDVYVVGSDDGIPTYWKNGVATIMQNNTNPFLYSEPTPIAVSESGDVHVLSSGTFPSKQGKYWKNGSSVVLSGITYPTSIKISGNDVYISGYTSNNYGVPQARLWKNGVVTNIGNGKASFIALTGSDIQLAVNQNAHSVAKYWKNDTEIILSDGLENAHASAIAVSNGDVHIVGDHGPELDCCNLQTYYWKNGDRVKLTDGMKATALAVSNSNVHVTGLGISGGSYGGLYWMNGSPTKLGDYVSSIALNGDDVYISGSQSGVARYWKNGAEVVLDRVKNISEATSIAVSGNDVYVSGKEKNSVGESWNLATYWKNGVHVTLTSGSTSGIAKFGENIFIAGEANGRPAVWKNESGVSYQDGYTTTAIAVSGNDIYVSGNGYDGAKYWKNGVAVILPNGKRSYATGICVVPK